MSDQAGRPASARRADYAGRPGWALETSLGLEGRLYRKSKLDTAVIAS